MMIALMENYGFKAIYTELTNLEQNFYILDKLLKHYFPQLHHKLYSLEIKHVLYSSSWFINLFSSILPIHFIVRILDLFLYKEKFLYQSALAVFKFKEKEIGGAEDQNGVLGALYGWTEGNQIGVEQFIGVAIGFRVRTGYVERLKQKFKEGRIKEEQKRMVMINYG